MRRLLLHSLLDLAHATSQNLGFSQRDDVYVSYGEETITETNLLELRRRHPTIIKLHTFSKTKESRNGADWEWHIIGRRRKFRMRVQAKRLQKNGVLRIPHKVGKSGTKQIDLLISDARVYRMHPVYCIYSSENQRRRWASASAVGDRFEFEYGCLLASAHTVKSEMPKTLSAIETHCIPWHYLDEPRRYCGTALSDSIDVDEGKLRFVSVFGGMVLSTDDAGSSENVAAREFPMLEELNAQKRPEREIEGLIEADDTEYERRLGEEEYRERGIGRVLEIDVRQFPASPEDEAVE